MTTIIQKYKWPALLAVALAVFSALIFFLIKSYTYDTTTYFESRDFIRQLKQSDANWNVKILRKKIGVNNNLSLVPPPEAGSRWEQLERLNNTGPLAALWNSRRQGYVDAIKNKTLLVEEFERHNTILRTALDALPTAEDDIQTRLKELQMGSATERLTAASNVLELTLTTMEYAAYVTSDKAREVESQLSELENYIRQLPTPYQPPFVTLTQHVRSIIEEQPIVNDLLDRINVIPVAQELDNINELLNETQRRTAETDRQYHIYLAVCASLMALLMIYLAVRLVRSYAVINLINHELQSSNERLEERVEERTRELMEAERELVDAARMAGMAEIATNVLHNVGNVLNSVNISAELVTRKLKNSKTQGLGKAVKMMNEHTEDLGQFMTHDEKGKLLPRYFNELVDSIAAEQALLIDELAQLTKSVDHIKEIVTTQQSYAGAARLIEPLNVSDLFEDALRMNSGALNRHHVTVIKDYQDAPRIMGDKHRLLLVLINLISNAKFAMSHVPGPREMTLGVRIVDRTTLCLSVKDRGEGIAPDNLARIFNHGFTTRKDGHGFGLHSCALAAVEMNGRLHVHSDGPGQGALFTLEIPLELAQP
ncbi:MULTISPECIES: DAHL domain-containing protein [unclassified Pseudomonas]|uniref:DAHL domain-containing protein n=1 Tax=unclassified Pseudomonas TaxID=196821 RepID=UPI00119AF2CA|nr:MULTISPECIES: DAHL domain-containing protein [unclassified Pseudomonas]TWC23091.1 histidine kinase/DNA gyrase B/HSP90-like ATPase [Pseudomonas sp. SJZ075]TWC24645.1 histidine kinase/DNA gyrase B/HSP90-like ATPase [Pseudomonas sp. SJZ074]TWC38029.1 histidine kinase/DNA gyrase B/HSP90-like ATPase [Pseudomonas sp. SJZ078]TWC41138.1 histidine kinase/DNA gyrase B/HSP90-like ATPase [Pseudomonas sp. SJZ085]TWC58619.1 histidine kinase/DNA gyrase B/HSP90-like ATPase [Pseudomonas sp. SJZ124]